MIWYASPQPWLSLGFVYCVQTHHYVLGPCYGGGKKPVWHCLCSSHLEQALVPWLPWTIWPVSLRSTWTVTTLQCSGKKTGILRVSTDVCSWGWASPCLPNHRGQNTLAPYIAENHTSIILIRWPSPVNECRGCCKNTQPASAPTASAAIASSARDARVPPQKTSCIGVQARPAQTGSMDGYTKMPVRADFGQMVFVHYCCPNYMLGS